MSVVRRILSKKDESVLDKLRLFAIIKVKYMSKCSYIKLKAGSLPIWEGFSWKNI